MLSHEEEHMRIISPSLDELRVVAKEHLQLAKVDKVKELGEQNKKLGRLK